nr:EOG090X0CBY [Moina brachiata]
MADSLVQSVLAKASEEEAEKLKSIQVEKAVSLEYDVGNLTTYDINDLDLVQLRNDKDNFLINLTRDNVQLLINQIFQLPTTKVDNEVVIKLPEPTTRLPRAKPVPKAKVLTKWEKYAKEKGITQRKKSKMEFDEELKKWVPTYGYKKNVADNEKNWVVELPGNAKDSDDPRAKVKTKKREAGKKTTIQRPYSLMKSRYYSRPLLGVMHQVSCNLLQDGLTGAGVSTRDPSKFQITKIKEREAHIEQLKIDQNKVDYEERRKLLQEETKQNQQKLRKNLTSKFQVDMFITYEKFKLSIFFKATEGMSGREIAKLGRAWQTAGYASADTVLTEAMIMKEVQRAMIEHKRMVEMKNAT